MTNPKIIGHYEIVDLIGRGGMGEVYKAVDTQMYGRTVAIKLASEAITSERRAMELFQDEVRTAATLRHPNIITIHDRGEYEGRPYFIMEYLEGTDLAAAIADPHAMDIDRRLEVALQIAEALEYAHRHGVVHRDVKPANIMFVTRSKSSPAKLLDFGIAKVASSERTRTTVQPGTAQYMAPEQLRDEPVDGRSDLFSLGIVLYELITGAHPFASKSVHLVTTRILNDPPVPARSVDPSIPEQVDGLLTFLLKKRPSERPQSAQVVVDAIRQALRNLRGQTSLVRKLTENLDAVTTELVESILRLSRKKEHEGDLHEALRGYRRAALLDPHSISLELKILLLEGRIAESGEPRSDPGDRSGGPDASALEQGTFVSRQLAAAEQAMDAGELDRASSILAEILRKFPDEPRAMVLLDRLIAIGDQGIPYPTYRAAIKQARLALDSGAHTEARRALGIAESLWPGDQDVIALERDIEQVESRRQVEQEEPPPEATPEEAPGNRVAEWLQGAETPLQEATRLIEGEDDGVSAGLGLIRNLLSELDQMQPLAPGDPRLARFRADASSLMERGTGKEEALQRKRKHDLEVSSRVREAAALLVNALDRSQGTESGVTQALADVERAIEILGEARALDPDNSDVAAALGRAEAFRRETRMRLDALKKGREQERKRNAGLDLRAATPSLPREGGPKAGEPPAPGPPPPRAPDAGRKPHAGAPVRKTGIRPSTSRNVMIAGAVALIAITAAGLIGVVRWQRQRTNRMAVEEPRARLEALIEGVSSRPRPGNLEDLASARESLEAARTAMDELRAIDPAESEASGFGETLRVAAKTLDETETTLRFALSTALRDAEEQLAAAERAAGTGPQGREEAFRRTDATREALDRARLVDPESEMAAELAERVMRVEASFALPGKEEPDPLLAVRDSLGNARKALGGKKAELEKALRACNFASNRISEILQDEPKNQEALLLRGQITDLRIELQGQLNELVSKPPTPPAVETVVHEPASERTGTDVTVELAQISTALNAALAMPIGSPRETRDRLNRLKEIGVEVNLLSQDGEVPALRDRVRSALLDTEVRYAFVVWKDRYESRDVEGVLAVSSAESREELEKTFAERGVFRKKEKEREIELQIPQVNGDVDDARIVVRFKKKDMSGSIKKYIARWRSMTATLVRSRPGDDWHIQAMTYD